MIFPVLAVLFIVILVIVLIWHFSTGLECADIFSIIVQSEKSLNMCSAIAPRRVIQVTMEQHTWTRLQASTMNALCRGEFRTSIDFDRCQGREGVAGEQSQYSQVRHGMGFPNIVAMAKADQESKSVGF